MKNALNGYLTVDCKKCHCWKNTATECGCASPRPIDECAAFVAKQRFDALNIGDRFKSRRHGNGIVLKKVEETERVFGKFEIGTSAWITSRMIEPAPDPAGTYAKGETV